MDESKIIADILERLDRAIEHIITIKSDMYKASDFRLDSVRIYDAIARVQTDCSEAMRAAIKPLEANDDDQNTRLVKIEKTIIPPWVWAIVGGIFAALIQVILPHILKAWSS